MKLSIIMPFLNSHEIVRRQILHFRRLDLPDDVEILFMDDGSDPPLEMPADPPRNFQIVPTRDFRPWTSSLARNRAALIARGEWLFMVDGDYIVPQAAINRALAFDGDRLGTRRRLGILDEHGILRDDHATLIEWGIPASRLRARGTFIPTHPNHFVIRASLFKAMGGYREDVIVNRPYPQREDSYFKGTLRQFERDGKCVICGVDRPVLYMFPNGQFCGGDVDANPFGLFHTLTRKTARNHWYLHPRYKADSA